MVGLLKKHYDCQENENCPEACSFLFCNEQEIFCSKSKINDGKTAGDTETGINSAYLTLKN